MRASPPAHRALDVTIPFTVYRVIGRRPSSVYVDRAMNVRGDGGDGGQPLWDLVFEETEAQVGDQIQDRPGGIMLVGPDGLPTPVQLSPPTSRSVEAAFTHADAVLAADRALIEVALADGRLAIGSVRRIKRAPVTPVMRVFGPEQPLVSATT